MFYVNFDICPQFTFVVYVKGIVSFFLWQNSDFTPPAINISFNYLYNRILMQYM